MNALKFAARAKKMKNKPILNDINVSSATVSAEDLPLLKRYRDEIEALRYSLYLLDWYSECVCVRVCVRVRERESVCVCVRACVCN